jgi:hypothetical protein
VGHDRDTPRRRAFEKWLWDRHRIQLKVWGLLSAEGKQNILAEWERHEQTLADRADRVL